MHSGQETTGKGEEQTTGTMVFLSVERGRELMGPSFLTAIGVIAPNWNIECSRHITVCLSELK